MRRAALIAGNPVTTFLFLEEDLDSLGCILRVQQVSPDGLADAWERYYARVDQALTAVERDYGIGPEEWLDLTE